MDIPFTTIDWTQVSKIKQMGETGHSYSQVIDFENFTIRIVEYSANFKSDHWCQKGHIVYCLEGEFTIEFEDIESCLIEQRMSFVVSDDQSSHHLTSKTGAKCLIIDGKVLNEE